MGLLDVRFHGICTHYRGGEQVAHRVVLMQCDDAHRPLLAVPRETKIDKSGDPSCKCIVEAGTDGTDVLYELHGVHLTMADEPGPLTWNRLWDCGVPSLTALYRNLGPAAREKVEQEPPVGVAAWFDVSGGTLGPYISAKFAVAVRMLAEVEGDPQIVASCWQCPGTVWTFTIPDGQRVRVSNDCGSAGDAGDFFMHYRIARLPPVNAPSLNRLPACLPPVSGFEQDRPPGGTWGNASLLCSNSQYP